MLLFATMFVGTSFAQVIFEDNFDSQADWWPTCLQCGNNDAGYNNGADLDGTPAGWSYWRNEEYWNPYPSSGATPNSHPSLEVSDANHYGSSGKALTNWHESQPNSNGWGSDAILAKYLGSNYKELYVQFKIKLQPGWQWASGTPSEKMFRVFHWDTETKGQGLFFKNDTVGTEAPLVISDLSNRPAPYGTDWFISFRCDPQATNYFCSPTYNPHTSIPSNDNIEDGNWHQITFHVKLNSSAGVADGIYEMWMDGSQILDKTDMNYISSGGNIDAGWNAVAFGGNAFNQYSDPINKAEQWYAIDDVVVSTTTIAQNSSSEGFVNNTGNASATTTTIIKGDLNGDGVVDSKDAQIALDISVGKVALSADKIARGDVAPIINGISHPDGKINADDAAAVLAKLAGKINF